MSITSIRPDSSVRNIYGQAREISLGYETHRVRAILAPLERSEASAFEAALKRNGLLMEAEITSLPQERVTTSAMSVKANLDAFRQRQRELEKSANPLSRLIKKAGSLKEKTFDSLSL